MISLNEVTLIGNIGQVPEYRKVSENSSVAEFSIAITEKRKDKEYTEWVNIQAWNKTADFINKHATKGTCLFVKGSIKTQSWETDSGNRKYKTFILANKIQIVSGWKDNEQNKGMTPEVADFYGDAMPPAPPAPQLPPEDDMPF